MRRSLTVLMPLLFKKYASGWPTGFGEGAAAQFQERRAKFRDGLSNASKGFNLSAWPLCCCFPDEEQKLGGPCTTTASL